MHVCPFAAYRYHIIARMDCFRSCYGPYGLTCQQRKCRQRSFSLCNSIQQHTFSAQIHVLVSWCSILLNVACNKRTYFGDPIWVGGVRSWCGETWGRAVNSIQNNKYFHLFHPLIPAGILFAFRWTGTVRRVRFSFMCRLLKCEMLSLLFMFMCALARRQIRCKITTLKIGCVNTFGCLRACLKWPSADWVYCFAPKMVNFECMP